MKRLALALALVIGALIAWQAYLVVCNARLYIKANAALVAACSDVEREPYPESCGEKYR